MFSLVLLALTTALFLVGSTAEKVACEALNNPDNSEIFQVVDKKFIQPLIKEQYSKSSSLSANDITMQHIISSVSWTQYGGRNYKSNELHGCIRQEIYV